MARTVAELTQGTRITDYVSLGVIADIFPLGKVREILERTGRSSVRQRQLPAHVMMYYVIALALYMQVSYGEVLRCLLEALKWLALPIGGIKTTGKSGISQARTRLGVEPVKQLHDEVVRPLAVKSTRGAWYRRWKPVSIDSSTLDVADTRENERAFGRPGSSRGRSGYPQIRFVSFVENGTHVLFGSRMGGCRTGEGTLADEVIGELEEGMLCLADRNFYSFSRWKKAKATGADLVWRVKKNLVLPCMERLPDGSYLSKVYESGKDRRHDEGGIVVRVIEYELEDVPGAEPFYRLLTTIVDPADAPAEELAALYHERWEIETAFDELKTHLRGRQIVLRSKKPELVEQEFYGLLMAHFAVRKVMHDAALKADVDPDELSFVHAVRVIKRKLPLYLFIPPSAQETVL